MGYPYQRLLQNDSPHGFRISNLLTPRLQVMAVNEPFSLSYLSLRGIKAETLSLSIIALHCFSFKCKGSRYTSRAKTSKKEGWGKGWYVIIRAAPNKLHSEHMEEIQVLKKVRIRNECSACYKPARKHPVTVHPLHNCL